MARGWRYPKPSLDSAPICVTRARICAMHPFYLWVPCPSVHSILPTFSGICFFVILSFLFVVFVLFLLLCSRWRFVDIPLIFSVQQTTYRIGNLVYILLGMVVVVVVVVSHIQRIGCQPEKTTLHGGQSRSWSAEQGKENKRKSLAAYSPPPHPHTARSEKINKITRRIYRRYAGGRSRVRTRIPSARRLGLWVWLRKILHSRLR